MDNKSNDTDKKISPGSTLPPESNIPTSQPQSKSKVTIKSKWQLFSGISIILLGCGLICYAIFAHNSMKENLKSQVGVHSQQSMIPQSNTTQTTINQPVAKPTSTGPAIIGSIQWKSSPEQITPQMPLSLLDAMKYQPTPYSQEPPSTSPQLKYFTVGTWTSGPYKGDNLVDVIVTSVFANEYSVIRTFTFSSIIRVSVDGNKLIYFSNSSSTTVSDPSGYADNIIPATKLLITDTRLIPDLLSSYPQFNNKLGLVQNPPPFPITYKGKTELFDFQLSDFNYNWTPDLSQYHLLTLFFKGQKLYARSQSGVIPYGSTEDSPYMIQDVDHSTITITSVNADQMKNMSWIKKPTTPAGVFDAYGMIPSLGYTTTFRNGCTLIPTSQLAKATGFNESQLKQIATSDGQTYYLPTQADAIYESLYSYLTPAIAAITPATAPLSYDDFVQTDPVIIGKDVFGEYQIFYRSGYPDNIGGCGKPVIYLYPTKKTHVSVHFSPVVTLSQSIPSYNSGWNVIANPDGMLQNISDQKTYPYLYWEGVTSLDFPHITTGYVVEKEQIVQFLQEQLSSYGLKDSEKNDFLAYWVPRMQKSPYYLIHFYTTSDLDKTIPEYISPMPDTEFRILMWFHPLASSESIFPQEKPMPVSRKGFTIIEWGGVEN